MDVVKGAPEKRPGAGAGSNASAAIQSLAVRQAQAAGASARETAALLPQRAARKARKTCNSQPLGVQLTVGEQRHKPGVDHGLSSSFTEGLKRLLGSCNSVAVLAESSGRADSRGTQRSRRPAQGMRGRRPACSLRPCPCLTSLMLCSSREPLRIRSLTPRGGAAAAAIWWPGEWRGELPGARLCACKWPRLPLWPLLDGLEVKGSMAGLDQKKGSLEMQLSPGHWQVYGCTLKEVP